MGYTYLSLDDSIRLLYAYYQVLMVIATNVASYATTATLEKFWAHQKERFVSDADVQAITETKNHPLANEPKQNFFAERYNYVRQNFEKAAELERVVTVQDKYLYNICKPERLLDLVFNFIVYDAGIKKIARYQ